MSLKVRRPTARARAIVARGAETASPATVAINLRMPGEIHRRLKAELAGMANPPSMVRWIVDAMIARLDRLDGRQA